MKQKEIWADCIECDYFQELENRQCCNKFDLREFYLQSFKLFVKRVVVDDDDLELQIVEGLINRAKTFFERGTVFIIDDDYG